jgi:5-methylcytosine-specific restriction endonuclease McrA
LETKICSQCGIEQSIENFYIQNKVTGYRRPNCKTCISNYQEANKERRKLVKQKWHLAHKETENAKSTARNALYKKPKIVPTEEEILQKKEQRILYKKKWYQENRERHLRKFKEYHATHLEEARKSQKKRRIENPEYQVNWFKNHPGYYSEQAKKHPFESRKKSLLRYARRKRATIGKCDYKFILERDKSMCHICNRIVDFSDIHYDHVIPLSRGGFHSNDNIKISHSVCNLRKGTKLLSELTDFQRRGP